MGGHEGTWRCFKGQCVDDAGAAVGICGVCGHFDGVVGVFLGREGGAGSRVRVAVLAEVLAEVVGHSA